MIVADFMGRMIGATKRAKKSGPRHRTTYRAARRNIAKIAYRRAKRARRQQ